MEGLDGVLDLTLYVAVAALLAGASHALQRLGAKHRLATSSAAASLLFSFLAVELSYEALSGVATAPGNTSSMLAAERAWQAYTLAVTAILLAAVAATVEALKDGSTCGMAWVAAGLAAIPPAAFASLAIASSATPDELLLPLLSLVVMVAAASVILTAFLAGALAALSASGAKRFGAKSLPGRIEGLWFAMASSLMASTPLFALIDAGVQPPQESFVPPSILFSSLAAAQLLPRKWG